VPVTANVFRPRIALVAAEQPVRWVEINHHVLERRAAVEKATIMRARRIGFLVGSNIAPTVQVRELAEVMTKQLAITFEFGRREAQREIAALRAGNATAVVATRREDVQPKRARRRIEQLGEVAAADVEQAAQKAASDGPVFASAAAGRALHAAVLTSVGQALGLGRLRGALTAAGGPPSFSMRSEQLDKNSCDRCTEYHGTITVVDSTEFWQILPPAFCFGGGRCRGVMVFADGVGDLRSA
jgi:hypothetical protein